MTAVATPVRERPILFSGPMVRAILDGKKTQTRRVFRNHWGDDDTGRFEVGVFHPTVVRFGVEEPGDPVYGAWSLDGEWAVKSPYGGPGDRLWVREAWGTVTMREIGQFVYAGRRIPDREQIVYRAGKQMGIPPNEGPCTMDRFTTEWRDDIKPERWRPSIHMPRSASRITLEITDIRVERLQDMRPQDYEAEGCVSAYTMCELDARYSSLRRQYHDLWDSLNEKRGYGWDVNPWVWVIGFRRLLSERSHASSEENT